MNRVAFDGLLLQFYMGFDGRTSVNRVIRNESDSNMKHLENMFLPHFL